MNIGSAIVTCNNPLETLYGWNANLFTSPFLPPFFFFSSNSVLISAHQRVLAQNLFFCVQHFVLHFGFFFLVFERIILFYYLIILYINYTKYFFVEIFLGEKKKIRWTTEQKGEKRKISCCYHLRIDSICIRLQNFCMKFLQLEFSGKKKIKGTRCWLAI